MISELKETGHRLTNEQQVQAIIHCLPYNWEHMKVHLTYNTDIKTFDNVVRHFEFEKDWVKSSRLEVEAYVANV